MKTFQTKVMINKREMKLLEEPILGVNVENCEHSCASEVCSNGGRCVPNHSNSQCHCHLGFGGSHCSKSNRSV